MNKKNKNFLDIEWFPTDFESAAFKSDTSLSSSDTSSSSIFDTSSPYKGSLESLIYTPKSVKFPSIFTSPSSMKME